jgi:P-type conjugative transfer protein VirB9
MRYLAVALPCFLLGLSVAQAADASKTSGGDARLSEMVYDTNRVFQIKVKKNTATRIVLADDERIISSATGFPSDCRNENSDWCVVANVGEHTLFAKPKARAIGVNNLELTTDKRIYSLELIPVRDASGEMPMYRVTFRYPEPELPVVKISAQAGVYSTPRAPTDAGPWQWDYTMQPLPGSAGIAPLMAYDDGQFTRLKFAQSQELPAIFLVEANGWESRVPVRLDVEGFVVLDRVGHDLMLRQGLHAVRIWKGASQASSVAVAD